MTTLRVPKLRLPDTPLYRHLLAVACYAVLAVLFTWPLAANLGRSFASYDAFTGGDPNVFVWYMDWTAEALRGALPVPAGQMLLYPQGVDPWASFDGPLMLALGVPVTLLSGNPVLAYGLFVLAALAANALAMYALLLRTVRSYGPALLGGAMFGFSTYALVRAGLHPNLIMIGTLPLLALAVIARGERPADWRTLAWVAGAAALNALSSWYYAVGGMLLVALLLAWQHRVWRAQPLRLLSTLVAYGGATVLIALPMLTASGQKLQTADPVFTAAFGAHPVDFVVAPPVVNASGQAYAATRHLIQRGAGPSQPNAVERSAYFGLPLLALTGVFIWRRRQMPLKAQGAWIAGFGLFAVLSLGTELRAFGTSLPMPFALLHGIFPFSMLRVPNRLFVPALLCATVMAAATMEWLRERGSFTTWRGRLLGGAVLLFMLAERVIFPYPMFTPRVSAFHLQLAADPETFAIADLPVTYPGFSEHGMLQTWHGKPTVSGEYFYPAYTDETWAYTEANPLLQAAFCAGDRTGEVAPSVPNLERDVWPDFRARNIRYAVVHHSLLQNEPNCRAAAAAIKAAFAGEEPYFLDGVITVYRVPPAGH